MSLPILYLVKLSISLAIVWLFYHLLLRKLTFYSLNRWYLLGYSLLAFLIPLINIDLLLDQDPQVQPVVIKYIPVIGHYALPAAPSGFFARIHAGDVFLVLAAVGSLFLMARFFIRWQALRKIRRHATLVRDAGMRIYQVDTAITPFSFGSAIYINVHQHTDEEWSAIIQHERVHVRQRHTIDILLAEFICMINWYNPFTWLIRHAIRQNLEFIADNRVVNSGCDKKSYQYHLLKVAGQSRYCLANNFNFSSLKKRIIMMNKNKSARLQLVKFLFIVPFLAVLLIAFRTVSASAPPPPVLTASVPREIPGRILVDTLPKKDTLRLHQKKDAMMKRDTLNLHQSKDTLRLSLQKDTTGLPVPLRIGRPSNALFIVDGVEVSKEKNNMNLLNPDDVQRIEVIKDDAARAIYGSRGENGVILITTKKAAAAGEPVSAPSATGTNVPPPPVPGVPAPEVTVVRTGVPVQPTVVVSRFAFDSLHAPLYIVDGVEKTREELNKIAPANIETINVYKDAGSLKKYGEKGKYGVVLVTMKKQVMIR